MTVEERDKLRRELLSLQEETRHEEKTELSGLENKTTFSDFPGGNSQYNNWPQGKDEIKDMDVNPLFLDLGMTESDF